MSTSSMTSSALTSHSSDTGPSTLLGRSGDTLWFEDDPKHGPIVRKWLEPTSNNISAIELQTMHSRLFARVLSRKLFNKVSANSGPFIEIVMPRYVEYDVRRDGEAVLLDALETLKLLWDQRPLEPPNPYWRSRLQQHLAKQVVHHMPTLNFEALMQLTRLVPEPLRHQQIHGDPTLANCVYDPDRSMCLLIDPCYRDYIPYDPHVDMGKMFQTCWGYERLITSDLLKPAFNKRLAWDLCTRAGLDYYTSQIWCLIHIVRLIPYQRTAKLRELFIELFNSEVEKLDAAIIQR